MDFREFLRFLRAYAWLILALLLLGGGGGTALALTTPKSYTATSQVLFTGSNAGAGQSEVYAAQYVLLRMPTFSQLATSRAVLEQASAALNGRTPAGVLAGDVATDVPTGTTLLSISVTQPSAERAQRASEVLSLALIGLVNSTELVPSANGATPAVSARVVSPPQLPASPSSPSLRLYVVGGALVGLLCGLLIGFVHWLRCRWKSESVKPAGGGLADDVVPAPFEAPVLTAAVGARASSVGERSPGS